jgi:monothiol glutaredoxin
MDSRATHGIVLGFHPYEADAPPTQVRFTMTADPQATIDRLLQDNKIMLFMKGNKSFPSCGFSHEVVARLKQHGAKFETFNVLADPGVRQQIKQHANWPTIPQLYVNGEFVGGCDIVRELDESGELATLVGG